MVRDKWIENIHNDMNRDIITPNHGWTNSP